MSGPLSVIPIRGLPEFSPGDDLAAAIAAVAELADGDVVVVAQKVVSKVEGAVVEVPPGSHDEDPRRALARRLAAEVVADAPEALIVRTQTGLVCANAGIDASNVPGDMVTLLPDDPDASARRLRSALREQSGADVAVVVADTFGRPWRIGQTDVAIGVAGFTPVRDERGGVDRGGQPLVVTEAAVADELAAAADLVRTKAEGVPVVVIRGFGWQPSATGAATDLVRPVATDLFARGRGMLAAALAEKAWPATWAAGVGPVEVARARLVAPDLALVDQGPPAMFVTGDALAAGLAAAVLADFGLRVRWRRDGPRVILEAGRPAPAG